MRAESRHVRSAIGWVRDFYADLERTRAFGLAAETAFWLFLSLIPFFAVAGLIAARISTGRWDELVPLLASLPEWTRAFIHDELDKVARWNGGAVGLTGAVVFVWLASTGVHAIFEAFEVGSSAPRSWAKKRLLALSTCVALSVVVAVLTALGPGLEALPRALASTRSGAHIVDVASSAAATLARVVLSLAIAIGYLSALYWVGMPRPGHRRATLLAGALVAALLQAAMSFGYAAYLSRFTEQAAYSAGLGLVFATLMTLYLFALSLLFGAAVIRKLDRPHAR